MWIKIIHSWVKYTYNNWRFLISHRWLQISLGLDYYVLVVQALPNVLCWVGLRSGFCAGQWKCWERFSFDFVNRSIMLMLERDKHKLLPQSWKNTIVITNLVCGAFTFLLIGTKGSERKVHKWKLTGVFLPYNSSLLDLSYFISSFLSDAFPYFSFLCPSLCLSFSFFLLLSSSCLFILLLFLSFFLHTPFLPSFLPPVFLFPVFPYFILISSFHMLFLTFIHLPPFAYLFLFMSCSFSTLQHHPFILSITFFSSLYLWSKRWPFTWERKTLILHPKNAPHPYKVAVR